MPTPAVSSTDNLPPDMIPATIDDPSTPAPFAEPAAAPVSEVDATNEPAPHEPAPPPSNSARDEIAAKFLAKRQEEEARFVPKETPPFVEHQPSADDPDIQPVPQSQATAQPESKPLATAPETFSVKVRGQTYSATRDQLIAMAGLAPEEAEGLPMTTLVRSAQTMEASRSYLEEAKSHFQSARSAATAPAATPAVSQQSSYADPQHGTTDPFLEAVERIQYGDPVEARTALDRAMDAKLNERDNRARIMELQSEGQRAIAAFSDKNADLTTHPVGSDLLLTLSVKEIANDFLRLGAPQEQILPLLANPELAYKAYNEARAQGILVRPPSEILESASENVRSALGIRRPTTQAQAAAPAINDRVAAKRALPQQPSRSVASPAQTAAPSAPPSRSQAIQAMRAARGQR